MKIIADRPFRLILSIASLLLGIFVLTVRPAWAQGEATMPAPAGSPPPGVYYPPPPPGYPPPGAYPAYSPYPPPPPPDVKVPASATTLGLGYKIGNGLGFLGGDILLSPAPHVVLDLQANTFSAATDSGTATGFGLAPALQFYLNQPGLSTPYASAGYVYAELKLGNAKASASGFFVDFGYEWKWSFGMGVVVGGGVCYLGNIKATDGSINHAVGLIPSIEAGIRWMFL